MNELERQLQSCRPRRPSARLERRLFGTLRSALASGELQAGADDLPAFRLSWLIPTGVALLLACTLVNQRTSGVFPASPDSGALVAMVMSNQSAAAWLPGSFQRQQNGPPTEILDWTKGNESLSSNVSLLGPRGKQ